MSKRIYRLAKPGEYPKLHAFAKEHSGHSIAMTFPTVVCEDDGEVRGLISTVPHKKAIIVGKFVSTSPFIALRLIEAYENLLRHAGVTLYLFPVATDDGGKMSNTLSRTFGIQPYASDEENDWYKREIAA